MKKNDNSSFFYFVQIIYVIKLKRSFIINGLSQYFGNTSCHYQAKISKEKTNIINSNRIF